MMDRAQREADRIAEEGLGAAAAVALDVDGRPGARLLTGRTGRVRVSRELYGSRRTLFRYVATVVTWTPGDTSWTFHGPPPSGYELGVTRFAAASQGHPDQLSGHRAAIATSYVEVQRPVRVVRSWTWIRNQGDEAVPPGGTVLTATLDERTDDDGEPWTTVTFVHSGLPVEWLDDLDAWWTYQLDMADFRDFGSD